jgi:hypothetical protein
LIYSAEAKPQVCVAHESKSFVVKKAHALICGSRNHRTSGYREPEPVSKKDGSGKILSLHQFWIILEQFSIVVAVGVNPRNPRMDKSHLILTIED